MLLYWKCFLFVDVSCADLLLNKSSVDFQNTPNFFGGWGRGWERWIASLHLPPFILGQTILKGCSSICSL